MGRSFFLLTGILFVGLLLVGALVGFSIRQSTQIRVLKLPHTMPSDHPVHLALQKMADDVKKASNGTLQIQIYENGILGDGSQIKELMQLNAVDIGKFSACDFEDNIPEFAVFSLPYLFRDSVQYWNVLESELGKKILSAGENEHASIHGLCFYDAGARSFYATTPIDQLELLANKKIRVMVSALMVQGIELLGATPTSMAWGELFTSLQNNTVDGAENNIPSFYTSRHYEVCKYFVYSEHFRTPDVLVINLKCWKSLSPEHQKILTEAAHASSLYQRELWEDVSKDYIAKMVKLGVEFKPMDQSVMREKVQPIYDEIKEKTDARSQIMAALVDSIRRTE